MNNHPIPPSSKLIQQWMTEIRHVDVSSAYHYAIVQSAQWGADQELEACCEWLTTNYNYPQVNNSLRIARRPKTSSLKEQALAVINSTSPYLDDTAINTIRRALEAL